MGIILATSILLFAVGSILKLLSILLEEVTTWLEIGSLAITFGGILLTVMMILAMFTMALRYHRGLHIPTWAESLVSKDN